MVSNDSVQGGILHKNLCQNNVDSEKAIEGNAALRNRCENYKASQIFERRFVLSFTKPSQLRRAVTRLQILIDTNG